MATSTNVHLEGYGLVPKLVGRGADSFVAIDLSAPPGQLSLFVVTEAEADALITAGTYAKRLLAARNVDNDEALS